jgi:hypothetical protein
VHRRTFVAMVLGAAVGAVAGIGALALAASRIIEGGLAATTGGATGVARAEFVVSQGGLYVLVVVSGLIGGALLGALGYSVAREAAPEARRVALGPLVILGAGAGVVVTFAMSRALVGLTADISGGVVTISVFRGTIVALAAGAATGLVLGGAVERLAHPEVYGFGGEAWPANPVAFLRDAAVAVGFPVLALVVGGLAVWGLSRVLLESSKEVAIVVFGAAAAAVLAAAAFFAAHPPRGRNGH